MAKFNYQHARKQKEVTRKSRQQEKQQRRSARPTGGGEQAAEPSEQTVPTPREGSSESQT